jgi:hypothetical protein
MMAEKRELTYRSSFGGREASLEAKAKEGLSAAQEGAKSAKESVVDAAKKAVGK